MLIEDELIKCSALGNSKMVGNPKVGEKREFDMYWKVYKLIIPQKIMHQKKEIIHMITKALDVWGYYGLPEGAHSVSVEFTSKVLED